MGRLKKIRHLPPLLCFTVALLVKCLCRTLRVTVSDPNGFLAKKTMTPCIVVSWHNRLLALPGIFPRHQCEQITVLISRSRDGNYIADLLREFGLEAVRGSSSRGGAKALKEMKCLIDDGGTVVITPDGPLGPRYEMKSSVCWLAAQTGVAIIPISLNARSHWQLRGWDRTQIPKPFSRCELIIGDPISIESGLDSDALYGPKEIVKKKLMAITYWDK